MSKLRIIAFFTILLNSVSVFAYDCTILTNDVETGQTPSPLALVCLIGRVINVFVLVAGVALVYMILWGALKLSMSQGDPKGYMAWQNTWFYAFVGFLVVVGFIIIYTIIANIFGLPVPDPNYFINEIEQGIIGLLEAADLDY